MARKDRSGSKYEQLLEASLRALGYQQDTSSGKNYIHPPVGGQIAIPGTYTAVCATIWHNSKRRQFG
jgi:hypothetical protein